MKKNEFKEEVAFLTNRYIMLYPESKVTFDDDRMYFSGGPSFKYDKDGLKLCMKYLKQAILPIDIREEAENQLNRIILKKFI